MDESIFIEFLRSIKSFVDKGSFAIKRDPWEGHALRQADAIIKREMEVVSDASRQTKALVKLEPGIPLGVLAPYHLFLSAKIGLRLINLLQSIAVLKVAQDFKTASDQIDTVVRIHKRLDELQNAIFASRGRKSDSIQLLCSRMDRMERALRSVGINPDRFGSDSSFPNNHEHEHFDDSTSAKGIWQGSITSAASFVVERYQKNQQLPPELQSYKDLKDSSNQFFDEYVLLKYPHATKESFYENVKKAPRA